MADRIEPALSAEDIADVARYGEPDRVTAWAFSDDWGKVIAVANDALKDDDKRKITLGTVVELRRWAEFVAIGMKDSGYKPEVVQANFDRMRAFAAALASYLPPEVP